MLFANRLLHLLQPLTAAPAVMCLLMATGVLHQDLPAADLLGTSWQLVKFHDKSPLPADERKRYTIAFAENGRLTIRFDCNRGQGTWKSPAPGKLEFGPLALTRAKCPAGSLHDQLVREWRDINAYAVKDKQLMLLRDDQDYYVLERLDQ